MAIHLRKRGFAKAAIEERRVNVEENKFMAKILAEENKILFMNRDEMDVLAKEWHDMAR